MMSLLNRDLKRSIRAQHQDRTESGPQEQTDMFMNELTKAPEHIRSYSDHPALPACEEMKQSGNL